MMEHWLTGDEMRGCAVSGYTVAAFFSRSVHIRGGVAVLVRSDVRFECLAFDECSVEMDGEVVGIRIPEKKN